LADGGHCGPLEWDQAAAGAPGADSQPLRGI
jgi:hypothetical protein